MRLCILEIMTNINLARIILVGKVIDPLLFDHFIYFLDGRTIELKKKLFVQLWR